MLSKSSEYAIRAVVYIAAHAREADKISIEAVCRAIGTPRYFTAKLLQTLSRKGIISSTKGPNGGFGIAPGSGDVSLESVVEAIDGSDTFNGCILGLSDCSEDHPCPLHHQYKGIRAQLNNMLRCQSIGQLAERTETGAGFVNNRRPEEPPDA